MWTKAKSPDAKSPTHAARLHLVTLLPSRKRRGISENTRVVRPATKMAARHASAATVQKPAPARAAAGATGARAAQGTREIITIYSAASEGKRPVRSRA